MLQMIKDLPLLPEPKKIRIKFSKKGSLIYISHLDLTRTMTRALVRARVPVKYTEGFNPRPKLVFATPLSVGCASRCEYLDIKIDRAMSCRDIGEHLNAVLPPEIRILSVYHPETKFTDAVYSSYVITMTSPSFSESTTETVAALFDMSRPLVVNKRSKSGDKDTDIRPMIRSVEVEGKEGKLRVNATLCVSSAEFLNPEYLVDLIERETGVSFTDSDPGEYTITRTGLYLSDGVSDFR